MSDMYHGAGAHPAAEHAVKMQIAGGRTRVQCSIFVPAVLSFISDGDAINGTHWHDMFAAQESQGCATLTIADGAPTGASAPVMVLDCSLRDVPVRSENVRPHEMPFDRTGLAEVTVRPMHVAGGRASLAKLARWGCGKYSVDAPC